jgi:hypothetical protein
MFSVGFEILTDGDDPPLEMHSSVPTLLTAVGGDVLDYLAIGLMTVRIAGRHSRRTITEQVPLLQAALFLPTELDLSARRSDAGYGIGESGWILRMVRLPTGSVRLTLANLNLPDQEVETTEPLERVERELDRFSQGVRAAVRTRWKHLVDHPSVGAWVAGGAPGELRTRLYGRWDLAR